MRRAVGIALAGVLFWGCSNDDGASEPGAGTSGAAGGGTSGMGGGAAATGGVGTGGATSGGSSNGGVESGPPCTPRGPSMDEARADATVLYSRAVDAYFAFASIALGPDGVYFGAGGSILRIPIDGGPEELVVADHSGFGLHVTDTHVYWLTLVGDNVMAADLWRAPLDTLPASAEQIAVVGSQTRTYGPTHLYFENSDADTLERVSLEGGTPTILVTDVSVAAMQVHEGYVYYTDLSHDGVFRVPVEGGSAEPLTSGSTLFVQGIATDGMNVYWADDEEITLTPVGAPAERTLLGYGGTGLMGMARVDELRLSQDRLFFDADDNIGWISVDGTQCDLYLADGFPDLGGWDLDDQYVYVVYDSVSAAEIWRFAR